MKNRIITIVFLGCMIFVSAQQKNNQKNKEQSEGTFRIEKLQKELTLSDEQVSKIKLLRKQAQMYRKEQIRKNKEILRNYRTSMKTEMQQILTPQQFEKWQQMKKERKERMKERRKYRKNNLYAQ